MLFCGPLGPGPWAIGYDGISPCFSSLVLDSIPVAILLVHIWPQFRSIYRQRTMTLSDRSASYWVQIMSCLLMTIFPIAVLLVHLVNVDPENEFSFIYPFELVAQLTQFCAWLCGCFIVSLANAYDAPINYGVRLWWVSNFAILCIDLHSQSMRTVASKDLTALLLLSCCRLVISAVLALNSILPLARILSRFMRSCLARPYTQNLHDVHHPWLQTQQVFVPNNGSVPDSQIWSTWLACDAPLAKADSMESNRRRINALNLLSWFEGIDTQGEPYVRFSIEVHPADMREKAWVFSSSFSDWSWLGQAVKKACESENLPFDLPEFPTSINHYPVAEIASILQRYLQRAVECYSSQAPLANFLQCQARLQYIENEIPCESPTSGGTGNDGIGEILQSAECNAKLSDNKLATVRQKINEVITTPIAAILERKIRPPSEEVLAFQTGAYHEKLTNANVVDFDIEKQPIVYEIAVSTSASRWSVRRRFKQFLELHSKLLQLYDDRLVPTLPSKALLSSPHHMENRLRQLDIFVQLLVNVPYFECRPLYDFLCNDGVDRSERSEITIGDCRNEQIHKFGISISKWQNSERAEFNPVYYFEVYEYFSLNQYLKWTICCTLSDFKELHASLRRRFPNDIVPDLPKWSSFQASADATFADSHATQLELFLQKLINCTPFSCPEMNAFLELDNGNRNISTGMHSVALP